MNEPTKRLPSPVESETNPLQAFLAAHPGAAWTIAKGAGIGAAVGLGVGLGLPGRGASHRAAVTLLFVLGIALVGGLIATAIAVPRDRGPKGASKAGRVETIEAKMKSGSSSPVPRRMALASSSLPKAANGKTPSTPKKPDQTKPTRKTKES